MGYLANVLATNPKAFYRLSDKGGPFRHVSPGDPAVDETGNYGGVYVLGTAFTPEHGDDLVTGHYPGMAYETPGLQTCDTDDGAFFYGTVLASEGVPPSAGEPQGCVQTTDPIPFSFHDRIPFSVVFSHAGCLGKRYEALHDYEIVLAGGIVGTQTAADEGGFRGWGCYTILDDTGVVPQYKLRFMRGNAGGVELVLPDSVVVGGGEPQRMRNYCVYDGSFMTIYSDLSIAEFLAGSRPFPWSARQGSTAHSGTGAGLTIGSLDFNTVYSGYWGNLEGSGDGDGGAVDDVIIYDRALDDDTVLYLDGCAGVVPFTPSGAAMLDISLRAERSTSSPAGHGDPDPVHLSGVKFRAERSDATPADPTDETAKAHLSRLRFRSSR